ncbi:sulfotransferase domain-containing protein [Rasiella sp. SM2506]|uniref:sulfotransferase domain-containing protein n=1 Tax=Rasiella sp. SM2506 TaxID=3423914 RepID=UPI003D7B6F9F
MISINLGTVKPSFMIIGVQKGGTSSIYHYLAQHSQIIAPKQKELHYFDTFNPTPNQAYLKFFPKSYLTKKISFDATPRYIYYPGTAKKIYDFDPKMKFIVVLRDPVKRAFSAWNMYRQMALDPLKKEISMKNQEKNPLDRNFNYFYSKEFPSFYEWINFELSDDFPNEILEPSIIRRGHYSKQIQEYLKYFSRESFIFIDFKNLKTLTMQSLNEISDFLKISHFDKEKLDITPQNKRTYTEGISEEIYEKLIRYYRSENKELEELTGLKLDWMHKI